MAGRTAELPLFSGGLRGTVQQHGGVEVEDKVGGLASQALLQLAGRP